MLQIICCFIKDICRLKNSLDSPPNKWSYTHLSTTKAVTQVVNNYTLNYFSSHSPHPSTTVVYFKQLISYDEGEPTKGILIRYRSAGLCVWKGGHCLNDA